MARGARVIEVMVDQNDMFFLFFSPRWFRPKVGYIIPTGVFRSILWAEYGWLQMQHDDVNGTGSQVSLAWFLATTSSAFDMPSDVAGSGGTNFLLIGNPGTGKRTILNGLIGRLAFKSGQYMDTPGLSDAFLLFQRFYFLIFRYHMSDDLSDALSFSLIWTREHYQD